ncbi:MAG TPA: glycosyltransferase family 39 protein, partial [Acidimicrobiales bacterium]|nr:glycosyltransferase family 39 protein [Acidimicrobiales bacterium]
MREQAPERDLLLRVGVASTLVLAVALRFWTPTQMWLDEALTVNISKLPLHAIPGALRRDGAPPLYYYLLHVWMKAFGSSNLGARSLSAVIGVVNLPLIYLLGQRVGLRTWLGPVEDRGLSEDEAATLSERSRVVAWTCVLLLATSPFAIYYDTESRMYSLVMLLTTTGLLSLIALLSRPPVLPAAGLAVSTGLLL